MANLTTLTRSAALVTSLALLSACGNKGPLFIPDAPATPQGQQQTAPQGQPNAQGDEGLSDTGPAQAPAPVPTADQPGNHTGP